MEAIIRYNHRKPRRGKNMDYRKVIKKHEVKIREWHSAGWTYVEIEDGLQREGEQVSSSQVGTILSLLNLSRGNKGQRARNHSAIEIISPVAPEPTTTFPIAHGCQSLPPIRHQSDQEMAITETDGIIVRYDAEFQASSIRSLSETRETPVSSNSDGDNDIFSELTSIPSSPATSDATSLETPGDESDGPPAATPSFYGSLDDDDDESNWLTRALRAKPSTAATLRAAESLLASQPVNGTRGFIQLGQVFATVVEDSISADDCRDGPRAATDPGRLRYWLVVKKYKQCCFCIRIRTYGRNGIRHLKRLYEESRVEDRAAVQKDIDAHAIVYPAGCRRPFFDKREEPFMRKESLGIRLDDGLEHGLIDPMSRASFQRLHAYQYDKQVWSVGRLKRKSRICMKLYTDDLLGDTCARAMRC